MAEPYPLLRRTGHTIIQFRVDGISDLLANPSPSRCTPYVEPGFRVQVSSHRKGQHCVMSVRLQAQPGSSRPAVKLIMTAWCLSRTTRYFEHSFQHKYIAPLQIWGWPEFLSAAEFQAYSTLRVENAILMEGRLIFESIPDRVKEPTLGFLYDYLLDKRPSREITYTVFSSVDQEGRLHHSRKLRSSLGVLQENGLDVVKLETTGLGLFENTASLSNGQGLKLSFEGSLDDIGLEEWYYAEDGKDEPAKPVVKVENDQNAAADLNVKVEQTTDALARDGPSSSPTEQGDSFIITGASATTWEAFLFWLHTGQIVFAPLKIDPGRTQYIETHRTTCPRRPIPCSCKAIYHIAYKLNIHALKELALTHLENSLKEHTALEELFSPFTARYEEVKKMEMVVVVKHWKTIRESQALKDKLNEIAEGKLPHAGTIMSDLLVRAALTEQPAA